jgi:hypothetical protein
VRRADFSVAAGVAAIMGMKVDKPGATDGTTERGLDATPRRGLAIVQRCIGHAVRAAEYLTLTVRQVRQRSDDTRMQWHTSVVAVLGIEKDDLPTIEINLAPVEP